MVPPDSSDPKRASGRASEVAAREAERRERLAAALRENLRKRKAKPREKRDPAEPKPE
ncbi:hypothetical protein [Hansschlegelia plantiphila]|uniref:Uncharacterized protein n=1 Tax=Hansschlegelia plantiphila TaxID=374655 RepID=A0A9W6MW89_9HYPH|nr:hypothetical protein [Hansschlegelia plantiphila]GLK68741.1 hypothetical protein GCM10008179_23790 [Hansschlegelia plantiphila]